MRLGRFCLKGESPDTGALWGLVRDGQINVIEPGPFRAWKETGRSYGLNEVKLLAPCPEGVKIICAGLNYRRHALELGVEPPDEPVIFLKASSAIAAPGSAIVRPSVCGQLDYEAELALIIGERSKNCSPSRAREKIVGYTCFNDVTARDIQKKDGQWTRAKSFDTFAPLGPYIFIPEGKRPEFNIRLYLNGSLKQSSTTLDMIHSPEYILSYVSSVMTLEPGDIIATGTPPGIGEMRPGESVEVEIDRIGKLKNYVVQEGEKNV